MSGKKSIFERLGMIEKIEENTDQEVKTDSPDNEKSQEVLVSEEKPNDAPNINKLMSIQEVYRKSGLVNNGINTIFIVDSFAKALPDNLPTAVKRQSVLNLISTSGMDVNDVLKDGKKRLMELGAFAQIFTEKTDEAITKNDNEIKKLTQKINEHKKCINDRKKLKQEQVSVIEYETQKIRNIIQFIEETQ